MHKPNYSMALKKRYGKIWLSVTAFYGDMSLEVFRMCEDGRKYSRNIYFRQIAGYYVLFPGETFNMGYGYEKDTAILEPWGKCLIDLDPMVFVAAKDYESLPNCYVDEYSRETILGMEPEFKYILDKNRNLTCVDVIKLLPIWRHDHKVELLLQAGFKKIAFNRSFWKMGETRRREITIFLRHHIGNNWNLNQVQTMIKENIGVEELEAWERYQVLSGRRCTYRAYRYLEKMPGRPYDNMTLYADYIKMAKRCGHDVKEDYWAAPKDLRKAHNKILKEFENVKAAEEAEKRARQQAKYIKVVKSWLKKQLVTDKGLKVYVPETVEDIASQAEALNQCLIRCDYVSKVVRRDCLLVFIVKGNKRIATAEILKDGKLGQFYGDESKADCMPNKSAREALELWQNQFIKKVA